MEREKMIPLVTAAQSGDPEALNQLFNEFYNDVYYFALKTVKDDQIAGDVTQETFVEILNTIGDLQEPAAFVKWMRQITYHQCTRYFKKKKDVIVDEDEDGATVFDTLQEENAEFIPDEALDQAEFRKTILEMIDELSPEQRAAIMLFYYDELTIKQIAEIQGTNENTVKSRLNYAKKNLQKSVEEYEKKNGIKLRSVAILPLLAWLLKSYFAQSAPATAVAVANGVGAATGIGVSASGATTTAATTTAVGIGAKIAALPLVTKIVAGVTAAAIAIGGGTAAVILSGGEKPESSIVETTDATTPSEATDPTKPAPTLEQRFQGLPQIYYPMGLFDSVDALDAAQAFHWAIHCVQPIHEEKDFDQLCFSYTYSTADLDAKTKHYFGKTWDYSELNDGKEYRYESGEVTVTYYGAWGDEGPEVQYQFYVQMDENTYVVAYSVGYSWQEYADLWLLTLQKQGDSFIAVRQVIQEGEEEEEVFRFYDPSRIADTSLTKEDVVRYALKAANNVAGYSGWDEENETYYAIYAADSEAACHSYLDIFGYGLSMDECMVDYWGSVYINSLLIGENMDVQLRSIQVSTHVPIEDPGVLPKLIWRDIEVFENFIGEAIDPYLFENHQGTLARDLDAATQKLAQGTDPDTHLSLYTRTLPVVDGKNYQMYATISVTLTEGVYYYNVSMQISPE